MNVQILDIKMSIVNKEGRLFKLKNRYQCGARQLEFELVEDAPQLSWNPVVDSDYRVTIDGKIYSVLDNKIIETEETGFKMVMCEYTLDSNTKCIKALLNDGTVISYEVDDKTLQVKRMTLGNRDVAYLIDNGEIRDGEIEIYNNQVEGELSVDLGEYGKIIDVIDSAIMITDSHICTAYSIENGRFLERKGKLIGTAALTLSLDNAVHEYILVVEEENNELVLRLWNEYDCMDTVTIRTNTILSDMHRECPWTDVISYDYQPYLVNASGRTIRIVDDCGIVGSRIPDYIFATTMMKSARSALRID